MSEQIVLFEAAKEAVLTIALSKTASEDSRRNISELIATCGRIKWRRVLSEELFPAARKLLENQYAKEDNNENPLEWLVPTLTRFGVTLLFQITGETYLTSLDRLADAITKVGSLDNIINSVDDDAEPLALNVEREEIIHLFKTNVLALFLFCLYHSDIRLVDFK